MRLLSSFPGPFRWFVPLLCLVAYAAVARAQTPTTITGTVYAPNGNDPLPNILVYVATPGVAVQPFQPGPGTACDHQNAVVSGNPIAEAVTDYKGNFSISSPALTVLGSATVNLVIQAGKWRRQNPETITGGAVNPVAKLVMPASAAQGDLPQIAVVTGTSDAVECVLQSLGIQTSAEVTDVGGNGHINLFAGTKSPGAISSSTSTATEAGLMSNQVPLSNYDVLMLGCQGEDSDTTSDNVQDEQNLAAYANSGGRIFATHYEYIWLNKQDTFAAAAHWRTDESSLEPVGGATGTITVDTSYPEGVTLANWLQYIGASPPGAAGYAQLTDVPNIRQDQSGVIAPTQSWGTLNPPYSGTTLGTPVMQFTFDTPLGTPGTPTVLLSYSNASAFLQGDPSDSITIDVSNTSTTTAANDTLTLTLALPAGVSATGLMGIGNTGWTCSSTTFICTRLANMPLAAETSDPILLTVSIAPNANVGAANITATLAGGGLGNSGQCGRVLFNEYHVEPPAKSGSDLVFPAECPKTLEETPAEKFLEFSLYNLSNFIAPTTADTITIQGPTAITWPPPAAIYYGTPLSATQYNATAIDTESSVSVPGTFTDTPPLGTLLNASSQYQTLSVSFTPTDATDYLTSTGTNLILVNPDPTTTALTQSTATAPAGQSLTFTATLGDTYYSPVSGSVTFYDGSKLLGTSTANAGVATYTTSTLDIGVHDITACLIASQNFLASCSTVMGQIITVPPTVNPTTTIVASDIDPSIVGQSVTFIATVATTGSFIATPTGTVNFFDGTTLLGSGTLTNGIATFSTTTLTAGTHNITAAYAGTTTAAASTSVILTQQVNTSVASAGTGFIMTVSPTTFSVGVGTSVSVGVTVLELNGFNQPINLSCAGLPAEATCTFATSTIPATGGSTPLTVTVAAPHNCNSTTPYFTAHNESRGLPIFAGVVFLLFARRRRALKGLLLATLLCILPAITGCGNCTDLGVKPGSYTFTVVGASGPPSTPTPVVVTVPGETTSSSAVTQTQVMKMSVTI